MVHWRSRSRPAGSSSVSFVATHPGDGRRSSPTRAAADHSEFPMPAFRSWPPLPFSSRDRRRSVHMSDGGHGNLDAGGHERGRTTSRCLSSATTSDGGRKLRKLQEPQRRRRTATQGCDCEACGRRSCGCEVGAARQQVQAVDRVAPLPPRRTPMSPRRLPRLIVTATGTPPPLPLRPLVDEVHRALEAAANSAVAELRRPRDVARSMARSRLTPPRRPAVTRPDGSPSVATAGKSNARASEGGRPGLRSDASTRR